MAPKQGDRELQAATPRFRSLLYFLAGSTLTTIAHWLIKLWLRRRRGELHWRQHVDFSEVQACILSTEHLATLGRVEKRTLFVKPLAKVFKNDYIRKKVLEAAEATAESEDPIMMLNLSAEDKWHVLNTCTNRLSSCFGPYHVFFNEARRTDSHYRSAWYCFTLTCSRTKAAGRWFITPFRPVGAGDTGMLRIRIILMNEEELREIASGATEAPEVGFFNGRHEGRWNICARFASLFARQLQQVTGTNDLNSDWGRNMCGTFKKKRVPSGHSLKQLGHPTPVDTQYDPEDNSMLRIHLPFPARAQTKPQPGQEACSNVVLYE